MYTNQDRKISPNILFNIICLNISDILDMFIYKLSCDLYFYIEFCI